MLLLSNGVMKKKKKSTHTVSVGPKNTLHRGGERGGTKDNTAEENGRQNRNWKKKKSKKKDMNTNKYFGKSLWR